MILHVLRKLVEAMQRPGLLGSVGIRREKACQRELAAYFRLLASTLPIEDLSKLADGDNKEAAVHTAEMRIRHTLRNAQPILLNILAAHLMLAYKEGWNNTHVRDEAVQEADAPSTGIVASTPVGQPLDILGPTGQRAADFAATTGADLVKALDKTTLERLRDLIAQGIEERLGVDGLARLIRDDLKNMSLDRAKMIATTEMNNAISTATLEKLQELEIEYKQWVPVDDPCEICQDNADEGAIPVEDSFSSGDDSPPAHPRCRCAVVGARAPKK
jgi:SPP1 gp7 family putative phage head morphogenesis protein